MDKKIITVFIVLLTFILIVGCKKKTEKTTSEEVLNSGIIKVDVSDDESTDSSLMQSDENESSDDLNLDNNNSDLSNSSNESSDSSKNNNSSDSSKTNNNSDPNVSSNSSNLQQNSEPNKDNSDSTSKNSSTDKTDNSINDNSSQSDKNSKPSGSSNPTNTTSTPNNTTDSTDKKDDYSAINCRPATEIVWKKVDLIINSIKFNVRLSIPNDWSISNDGSIMRNGNVIGNILVKSPNSITKSYEETERTQVDNSSIIVKKSIYKNNKNNFKRLFSVSRLGNTGVMKKLYIDINYSELNSESASKLYDQLKFNESKTSIPAIDSSKSNKILIIGTKSLSEDYAKISSFLNSMCGASGIDNFNVEIITKSKSNALMNFANDEQLLSKIKNGEYAYVFQSGFGLTAFNDKDSSNNSSNSENSPEIENNNNRDDNTSNNTNSSTNSSSENTDEYAYFQKIYNACESGKTKLVLFPSFEDDMNVVQTILEKFDETLILNLKGELNGLITSSVGTDKAVTLNDFVDSESRLTKYAGFIAAHLLYRNIFGKIPPAINSNELAYTNIQSKFSDNYLTTGILPSDDGITTYILN